jgi:hypothetical protein
METTTLLLSLWIAASLWTVVTYLKARNTATGSGEKYLPEATTTRRKTMSHMTKPEEGKAYKYNNKTFCTFEEALGEEFYDKFVEALKSTGKDMTYLSYSKAAIVAAAGEIAELGKDYDRFVEDNKHPSIQSCVQTAASDFRW